MATIDIGAGHGARRSVNRELPLIPFIDFLLCLVAFLLVTAVWSQMARIEADARVPNTSGEPSEVHPEKELHVEMRGDQKFQLIWREGSTVINTIDVERKAISMGSDGDLRYPALAERIAAEWKSNGSHRATNDRKVDRAVLHTDNTTHFSDLIAVIDAVHEAQRPVQVGANIETVPAFNLAFAVN